MFKRLVLSLALLAIASPAFAWSASLSWSVTPGVTSYKIEKSVDDGVTWTTVTSTLTSPSFVYTGTETGLVMFRVSNCNSNGCTLRPADGMWHNEAWQPPAAPSNVAVQ